MRISSIGVLIRYTILYKALRKAALFALAIVTVIVITVRDHLLSENQEGWAKLRL